MNKIKKIPNTFLYTLVSREGTCAKFQLKLLKSMIVRTRQTFQFFRQNT